MEAPISTQATHNRRQRRQAPVHCFCRGRPRSALREDARSRARCLRRPPEQERFSALRRGDQGRPLRMVVCEAGTMGWLTGQDRGGGRRARCRRASRRRWGANGRPRARPGPESASSSKAARTEPLSALKGRCGQPQMRPRVAAPSMTAAARATCSSETPRAMRMPSMRSSAAICRASRSSTTCPSCTRMRRSAFWVMVTAERPSPR